MVSAGTSTLTVQCTSHQKALLKIKAKEMPIKEITVKASGSLPEMRTDHAAATASAERAWPAFRTLEKW